jgi:hypothetical protein
VVVLVVVGVDVVGGTFVTGGVPVVGGAFVSDGVAVIGGFVVGGIVSDGGVVVGGVVSDGGVVVGGIVSDGGVVIGGFVPDGVMPTGREGVAAVVIGTIADCTLSGVGVDVDDVCVIGAAGAGLLVFDEITRSRSAVYCWFVSHSV